MKTLNLINLYNAEIKKNQLAKIKGGTDIRCFCTMSNPFLSTKQLGGTIHLCSCENTTETEAGVYNRAEK